jgi:hypothetical protein
MRKIKKAFSWLKQYHRAIIAFAITLMMGMGIMPTVMHGEAFVAAIQYEQMAEASPRHIIIKEIEANHAIYILHIEVTDLFAVAWIFPLAEIESPHEVLYDLFCMLEEQFPDRKAYFAVVSEVIPVKGVDGECTVIKGVAEYGITQAGMKKMLGWGKANSKNSLDILFRGQDFWAIPFGYDAPFLSTLLPRESGHVTPWEAE